MHRIDAILMASGSSSRFENGNKLLYHFNGRPLVTYALDLACNLPFHQVHFVAAYEPVLQLAQVYPVVVHTNTNPERGACESIRLGVSASYADYFMFFVCDQPLLDVATVNAILAKAEPGKIVFPTFDGQPGMPSLFSDMFREELLTLADYENARSIKKRYPKALVEVPVKTQKPLLDIDTFQDFTCLQ